MYAQENLENDAVACVASGASFEVSDLVYYYATGNTPTGIQRVQQEISWVLLQEADEEINAFVVYDRNLQKWRSVPTDWLHSLISTARAFRGDHKAWLVLYEEFAAKLSKFPLRQFERGEWLVNVGASWSLTSYFVQIRQLRRRGIRFAVFLHDCIPVRHPAYFEYFHTVEHTYWLAQIRDTADLVICNSDATRDDYLELVKPYSVDDVRVCRLDASWITSTYTPEAEVAAAELLSDLGIFDDDFVLSVGTIEPRKNHITLVHVWDKLRNTHPTTCPKLICVGRIGWKSDAVISQAKALGLSHDHVFFTGALSDDVLAVLYKKCIFTMYVSFYEGWGLPVTESLQAGKVCIAGSNAALREAGAGCAAHVDERSGTDIYATVARFIDDPDALREASDKIRTDYKARDWSSIAKELIEIIRSGASDKPVSAAFPVLKMNTLYRFGRIKPIADFDQPEAAEVFCIGQSWHQPESWGTWTSKEFTELGFRISKTHAQPTVFLGLLSPPGGANLTISVNGKQVQGFAQMVGKKVVRLLLDEVSAGETAGLPFFPVRIRCTVSRVQNMRDVEKSMDTRSLGAGFLFMVCFDRNSILDRIEFLEKMLTDEI